MDILTEYFSFLLTNVLFGTTLGVLMPTMQRHDLGHSWTILAGEEGQDESEDSFRKKKES